MRQIVGRDDRVSRPGREAGFLDWLANDERAFSHAEEVAAETADALPAEDVDAAAGEADVALAIRDALATFPADEVVVAVGADDRDLLTERLDPDDGAPRDIDGTPLRLVVVRDDWTPASVDRSRDTRPLEEEQVPAPHRGRSGPTSHGRAPSPRRPARPAASSARRSTWPLPKPMKPRSSSSVRYSHSGRSGAA